MRLIDADALTKEIEDFNCKDCNHYNYVRCRACPTDDALSYIDDAPIVEDTNVPSKWISVKKKLPELAGRYLAYRPRFWAWGRGQATVCFWDGKNWFDDYVDTEEYKLSEDSVSHWMPLPEPPEVMKDG